MDEKKRCKKIRPTTENDESIVIHAHHSFSTITLRRKSFTALIETTACTAFLHNALEGNDRTNILQRSSES